MLLHARIPQPLDASQASSDLSGYLHSSSRLHRVGCLGYGAFPYRIGVDLYRCFDLALVQGGLPHFLELGHLLIRAAGPHGVAVVHGVTVLPPHYAP